MISRTTAQFRRAFAELPPEVQHQARRAYRLFRQNPNHPSLRFKPVHPRRPIYSVRISPGYRAVGILEGDEMSGSGSAPMLTMTGFFHNGGVDPNKGDGADRKTVRLIANALGGMK